MKESIKFGDVALTRLNKAAHLGLHRRVMRIVSESVAASPLPGLPAELMAEWAGAVDRLTDIAAHTSASILTSHMRQADELRDGWFTYLFKQVAALKKSPLKHTRDLALLAGEAMGGSGGTQRLAADRKSVMIDALIHDLRKERYAEALRELGLLEELERANREFVERKRRRNDEVLHRDPMQSLPVRRLADACLHRAFFLLEAIYLMHDQPELMARIRDIAGSVNAVMEEAVAKFNQIQGLRYGAGKKRIGSNAARRKAQRRAARNEAARQKAAQGVGAKAETGESLNDEGEAPTSGGQGESGPTL